MCMRGPNLQPFSRQMGTSARAPACSLSLFTPSGMRITRLGSTEPISSSNCSISVMSLGWVTTNLSWYEYLLTSCLSASRLIRSLSCLCSQAGSMSRTVAGPVYEPPLGIEFVSLGLIDNRSHGRSRNLVPAVSMVILTRQIRLCSGESTDPSPGSYLATPSQGEGDF